MPRPQRGIPSLTSTTAFEQWKACRDAGTFLVDSSDWDRADRSGTDAPADLTATRRSSASAASAGAGEVDDTPLHVVQAARAFVLALEGVSTAALHRRDGSGVDRWRLLPGSPSAPSAVAALQHAAVAAADERGVEAFFCDGRTGSGDDLADSTSRFTTPPRPKSRATEDGAASYTTPSPLVAAGSYRREPRPRVVGDTAPVDAMVLAEGAQGLERGAARAAAVAFETEELPWRQRAVVVGLARQAGAAVATMLRWDDTRGLGLMLAPWERELRLLDGIVQRLRARVERVTAWVAAADAFARAKRPAARRSKGSAAGGGGVVLAALLTPSARALVHVVGALDAQSAVALLATCRALWSSRSARRAVSAHAREAALRLEAGVEFCRVGGEALDRALERRPWWRPREWSLEAECRAARVRLSEAVRGEGHARGDRHGAVLQRGGEHR